MARFLNLIAHSVFGCTDLVGNLPTNPIFPTQNHKSSCALWAEDNACNYDQAIAAGTYDTAGVDTDGYAECSPLDERYITSCDGMPVCVPPHARRAGATLSMLT